MSDFSKKTLSALARKGLRLIGLQADHYLFNDNGTFRAMTFSQVLEAAR